MPLGLFGGLLLANTFLAGPLLLWTTYDHPAAWQILAVYLIFYLLLWGLTVSAYLKAHRAAAPDRARERRKHALMMLVSPATAMCGLTSLTVNLLGDFHPLAAAHGLLAEDQFRSFARLALRDAAAAAAAGFSHGRSASGRRDRIVPRGDGSGARATDRPGRARRRPAIGAAGS